MRMYGRANSAVVKATNAVRATRNTLRESTKNCWGGTRGGPARESLRGQHRRGDEGGEAESDVDLGRLFAVADEPEHRSARERDDEDRKQRVHPYSSFSFSRWRISRLSNCSRIWNMKTPRMISATSTSSAMPSSTTMGIP